MRRVALVGVVTAALVAAGGEARGGAHAESVVITDRPASLSASTNATFAFVGSSGVTAFRCELDGGRPEPCTSPKTYTKLAQGKHTFIVRGFRGTVDLGISDTYVWTIDSIPPETSITSPVPAETKLASVTLAFTANEPATFECKLDAQAFAGCSSPTTVSVGFGSHTFAVRARDPAGNVDPTPAVAAWTRKQNLSPVARVSFLVRPGQPKATSKSLIGTYAVPKALLGVDNVTLPVGEALKLSKGMLVLPAGATTPVVIEGKEYTFTGAASSDPDGKVVHYEWSVFTGGKYVKKQEGDVAVFTTAFKEVGGWSAVRLVVVDDEGAAGTTEFIVKVNADCTYEIVVGRFRAEADCFRRQTLTKQVAPPAKKGTQSPALVSQTTTRWTTWPLGYPARVNGITVDPEGKTKKLVTVSLPLVIDQIEGSGVSGAGGSVEVKSARARVTTPEAQLYLGKVSWDVEPGFLAGFELGGQITPTLRGLRIKGFAGLVPQPALTPSKGAAMKLWVALPEALGGATSDKPVPLSTGGGSAFLLRRSPASAGAVGDLAFTVENAAITPYFTVKKLKVEYTKALDRWVVEGRVVIDALGGVEAHLSLRIVGSSLEEILAKIDKLNLCAAQLVCLQKLELHVQLGKEDSFAGKVGLSLFQQVAGHTVASIEGGLLLKFPKGKAYAKVGGDVYVFDALRVAQGYFAMDTSGHVYAEGSAKLGGSLVGIGLGVEGKVYASYDKPHLDAFGKVKACLDLAVAEACAGAEALFSTKGLAVCLVIDVVLDDWRPGFGYLWGGGLDGLTIFAAGCDVGPYKATSSFQLGPYQLPAGGATVTIPAGLPGAVIAAQGATAPPKITVTGPNGEQVATPAGPGAVRERPFYLVQVAATKTTYVAIGKPSAGAWKVTQQPGSSPVVGLSQADGLAPPSVEAKVTGAGAKRTLAYAFSTRQGQTVRFWERGVPGRGTPPLATQVLATVVSQARPGRQRGTIGFTPAPGPGGKREIVAQVLQDGVPRRVVVVDTYTAPAPPALGAPSAISVTRSGGQVEITWAPVAQASSFTVRVDLADGQRKLFHTSSSQRKIRLDGVPAGVDGTVAVTSLRASTATVGPTKKAAIPG